MFNLEQSIAEWRRQMRGAGVKTPDVLDELESHLRDDVERHVQSGLTAQAAFEAAIGRIGQVGELKREFKKGERTIMKQIMIVVAGVFVVLCGVAFILPALAWYHDHGAMPAEHLEFLMLGIVITAGGVGTAIYGFKKRKA